MGSALEFRIHIRKLLVTSTRACYRSVCNHPFLVAFLCFLVIVYRSFPFLFSILVSASPVLVCTAVLLGTLLFFGQHNIPEVEKEEKVTHEFSSFRTAFSEGASVISERDENFVVERYTEKRSAIEDRGIEEAGFAGVKGGKVEQGDGLISYAPRIDEQSQKTQHVKQVSEGKEREIRQEKLKVEDGFPCDEEVDEEQYVFAQKVKDDILDIGDEKNPEELVDAFEGEHLDFSLSSSWRQAENNYEKEDSLESESDQAESSSPDASLADIIPMLDELHPLLDTEAPQPAHLSRDVSDGASEKSLKSKDGSVVSDEDDDDDGMDAGKEDESKSAIKWTEDDQKNLLDLGTSELERNQRLENLIARRSARKFLSMITNKNLIDLESTDLPLNVTPIATSRCNPFELPDDSHAAMGLPPIPGSAPSILHPRQNPFDIPYDSNEEKSNLKGDPFQEFTIFNQKDAIFHRHESFNLGSSVLGMNRQERHDINWKAVFVPERMASEGTSYSSFQRQSSEVSDSKLSSVPDTESVSSIDQDDRKLNEVDLSPETDFMSNPDHICIHVERSSQSSGEIDPVDIMQQRSSVGHDEVEVVLGGVENPSGTELCSETEEAVINEEFNMGEIDLRTVPVDEESSGRSSQSSLSEVIDNVPDEKLGKSANFHQGENHLQESRISTQSSVEASEFHLVSCEVEDHQHREPVYDSSPSAAEMVTNFSSVSSDSLAEFSNRDYPPTLVEMTSNVKEKESEVPDQGVEDNASVNEEMPSASSQLPMEVNNDLRSKDSDGVNQRDVTAIELSVDGQSSLYQSGSKVPKSLTMSDSVDSTLSSNISIFDDENISEKIKNADEKLDFVASEAQYMPSSDSSMSATQDSQSSLVAGQSSLVRINLPSEETEYAEKKSIEHNEQDKVLSSSSIDQNNVDLHQDTDKKVDSPSGLDNNLSSIDKSAFAPSSSDHCDSQKSSIIPVESTQVVNTPNNGVEVYDSTHEIPLNISSMTADASETPEFRSPNGKVDLAAVILEELIDEDQSEVSEQLNLLAEGYRSYFTEENVRDFHEIKEIDEGILSELDSIGDFSVTDASLSRHPDHLAEETTVADAHGSLLPRSIKITGAEQEIPVLEARSLEDIDLTFKQLQEGADINEVIVPSMLKDQLVSEESKDHLEGNSGLQIVEARTLNDIDIALKQISEGNTEEMPKSLDSTDGSVRVEENEVVNEDMKEIPDKSEHVHMRSSSTEEKSHSRKPSSSSSSSDSD